LEADRQNAMSKCEVLTQQLSAVRNDLARKNSLVAKFRRLLTQANIVRVRCRAVCRSANFVETSPTRCLRGSVVRTSVFGGQTFPDLCLIYG